jgi:protein ImuB
MRRVVSVFLPTRPTDRFRRQRKAAVPPADRPLITAMHDNRRQVVAAADRVARSLGLHPGMPLAQAQAVVSGLTVVAAEPEGNARALDGLAAWFLRYAQLTAPDRPDGIWIDATGPLICSAVRPRCSRISSSALRAAASRAGLRSPTRPAKPGRSRGTGRRP